ncbi:MULTISPECIES: BTAD domain-containing putative transcriptional regulator [unclassified Nocardioides]|uniref:nSTAND1 domain-containing NTPase n=1 Tax=unclassified Nocardioides TaxID=2615069 RepID=UPI00361EB5E1
MTGTAPGSLDSGAVHLLGRRDRVVFSALALSRPAALSHHQLAEALWPEGPPTSSAKVIQGCVSRLRGQFGADAITTLDSGYVLSPHAVTEADRFEQAISRGRDLLGLGQADRAAFLLDERLRAWTGAPYAELDHWPPAEAENTRFLELKLQGEELLVDALLGSGDLNRAVVRARAFAEQEPLRERRWAQLALAEYRIGQQAAALDALRLCRVRLSDELGIDPGPEVVELEVAILRQDPALAAPTAAASDEQCPWPGLSPYGPAEAESFFGRDDDIVAARSVLDARGCLAVVGPSGIGKSSFVRAGVVPALREANRSVQLITPSAHARVHGVADGVEPGVDVLVVDQAEELFALPEAERAALLDGVDAHPGPRIIVLRADQLTEVAAHPGLARLVEQGLFLLGGLSTAGLTAAVEKPAAQHGLLVEPGLVDLLLRDLEGEPAALPLFSHALAQTWSRREGRTLTVAGYRATGGVRGAVGRSAERVYAATNAGDRTALRSLMMRLVSLGSEGEPHRVRVPADQLTDPRHTDLVDALVRARLVTRDADTLTLTHEALVDGWPRLREWLDEDVDGRRVFHHLAAAARAWEELGRPDSELYRGVRLARAVGWAETADVALTETEAAFLLAGRQLADAEAAALEDQVRRQKRTNRVLRGLLIGVAVLLVAALVAGVLAVIQARRADQQSLEAISSAVGAKALKTDDPQLSLLLAAAAHQVSPSADTLRSLSSAVASRPLLTGLVSVPDSDYIGFIAAAGDRVFAIDKRHIVRSFDTDLRPVGSYDAGDGHRATVDPPLAANDDVLVVPAAPGDDRPIRLIDPASLTELPTRLRGVPTNIFVVDVSLSADGRRLAVAYSPAIREHPAVQDVNNRIRVWDLATGRPAGPPIEAGGAWTGVGLSADGRTVLSSTPVAAYDVATGAVRWQADVATWNNALDVHGNMLATANADSSAVQLYDIRTGRPGFALLDGIGVVVDIVFARDGRSVAASGEDGTAVVWDVRTGVAVETLDTGGPPGYGVAFASDGGTFYVAKPLRRQLQSWDLSETHGFVQRIGFNQAPGFANAELRFSPDATRMASAGWIDTELEELALTIFDLDTRRQSDLPVIGTEWLRAGAWNPAGDRYVAGYGAGWVQVVDADAGREVGRRSVTDRGIVAASYLGPERIGVATDDGRLLLLDASSLEQVGTTLTLPEDVAGLAGFADGRTAVVLGKGSDPRVTWAPGGRTWYRVDLVSGKVVQSGRLTMRHGLALALAPDESRVAFGGLDGEVEIVDLESGRSVRPAVTDGAGDVHHLAFDPEGDRLATGSRGVPMGLWDVATGTPLASSDLPEYMPAPPAVTFAPNGRILAASITGSVFAWDVSARAAVRYACDVAGRELTRLEWADAFGDDVPYRRVCAP